MFKNYLVVTWRILIKNKMYSAINLAGLAIGFACCVALGMYIYDEWSYDRFHFHKDNIYRVVANIKQTGGTFDMAVTPGPLAPALKADFPEVIQTCRIARQRNAVLEIRDKVFEPAQTLSVDHSFFELFDFKLLKGNKATVLLEPDEAIISEKLAIQCFGKDWYLQDALLGSTFKFNDHRLLTIAGIIQDPPDQSHLQFDLLLSFKNEEISNGGYNWDSNNYHTYVLLGPQADLARLQDKLLGFLESKNKYLEGNTLSLQPLLDIHLRSDFAFQTDWAKTSNRVYIRIFFAVGLIVLFIALFNFINLSTAKAVERMKEVGVRKAIGAARGQLITQFFVESLTLSFLAIFISYALLLGFIPILNSVADKSLSIPYTLNFLLVLTGFAFVSGLLAGIYPAIYLSGFKPVKVLKGIFDLNSSRFRQVLVISQFTPSIILIIVTIVIHHQINYLQNKDLGFDQSQLLSLKVKTKEIAPVNLMKQEMIAQPGIASVAATSSTLIDVINSTGRVKWQGQGADEKLMFTTINIDPDYLTTSGMHLIAGRNFDPGRPVDNTKSFIINETAASKLGWTPEEAVGKSFTIWDSTGNIIGVTRDFHYKPLTSSIGAFVFRYWPAESFQYLLIKIKPNHIREAISNIEKVYKKFDPKTNIQYEFVNELVEHQYRTQLRSGKIILYFSILTIFVSCLGLFGLVTFTTVQKTRQIGIRKVLGARVVSLVRLLSLDFIKLVGIAMVLAVPASIWLANRWLQDFAYKIELEWWMIGGAGLLALVFSVLTVSLQTLKAAMANPVKSLRSE